MKKGVDDFLDSILFLLIFLGNALKNQDKELCESSASEGSSKGTPLDGTVLSPSFAQMWKHNEATYYNTRFIFL